MVHCIGNYHLRKNNGTKQSLKDIIKIEYQKCAQDPIHFMKKY